MVTGRRKIKKGLFILALIVAPSLVSPNGSPINTGEIRRTGNIQMVQKKAISLEEEKLSVRILGDYAQVEVVYRLRNTGPADRVEYGFPVESDTARDGDFSPVYQSTLTDLSISEGSDPGGLRRAIPIKDVVTDRPANPEGTKPYMDWHIAEIPFKEYEEKVVTVSYRQKCRLEDMVFTKSFRPRFSNRTFTYSLKPARHWGEGRVPRCSVLIDARELLSSGGNILEIHPDGYTANGGVLSWDHRELDLSVAPDISLVYDNSSSAFTKYMRDARLPLSSITKVAASSVLRKDAVNRFNYDPSTLFDNDLNTAWVEGVPGSGVDEWVEIELAGNTQIEAIGIINGYTKNEAIYNANNRIRRIRLDVVYQDYWTGASTEPKNESVELDLTEKRFHELNRNVQAPFVSWLADYGMGKLVSKIRLTILAVARGVKYDDTCISELFLLGR